MGMLESNCAYLVALKGANPIAVGSISKHWQPILACTGEEIPIWCDWTARLIDVCGMLAHLMSVMPRAADTSRQILEADVYSVSTHWTGEGSSSVMLESKRNKCM